MKMKKILCLVIAVVMVALACPLSLFAEPAETTKATGVQSTAASDAQITENVCSIWYMKDGVETKFGDYNSLDLAMDAMYDLYKDPFVDATIVDGDDADTNVSNELYAAAGSPVIKLNGNHVGNYARPNWITDAAKYTDTVYYKPDRVVNFVIDGAKNENENYTITYNAHTQIFNNLAFYNVTVKNVNFVLNSGGSTDDGAFKWQGNETGMYVKGSTPGESWTIFENCVIDHNSTLVNSGSGCTFKINGNAKNTTGVDPCETDKYHLIFRDTSIYSAAGIGSQVHWGADANIELYNSVWTLDGTAGTDNNNDNIIKPYEAGDCYFYLDGTSKLISARSSTGEKSTSSLFRVLSNQKAPVEIVLEKGAELRMENTGTLANATYIADAGAKTTVTDKGANFTANANSVKCGVTLPTCFKDKDGVAELWQVNGVTVTSNFYKDASITTEAVFTRVADDGSAYVQTEASIAYIETSAGKKLYFESINAAVNYLNNLYARVTDKNITDEALWKAAGSPVICVYKDNTTIDSTIVPNWWSSGYDANRVKTVVIKGVAAENAKTKITSNVAGGAIQYNAYYNLTLENIELDCPKGFALFWSGYHGAQNSGKSTTNLINCKISAAGTSGEGLVFKVTGNKNQTKTENYIINMVGTEIDAQAGVNAVFLFHHGCAGELNIDGTSKITHVNDKASAGGDTVFMIGTPRYIDINIADGAEISSTVTKVNTNSFYSIFNIENSNDYAAAGGKAKATLNIAKDAKFTIDVTDPTAYTAPVYFIYNRCVPDTAKVIVNIAKDTKVKFTANAVVNGAFAVAPNKVSGNATILGWNVIDGDTTTFGDGVIAAGTYEGEVVVTPVIVSAETFGMVAGAAVKEDGIRYTTTVSKALVDALESKGYTLKFGAVVVLEINNTIPDLALTEGSAKLGVKMESTRDNWILSEDGETYTYYTALTGIDKTATNYVTKLSVSGYMIIEYPDTNLEDDVPPVTETIYTQFNKEDNMRTMYDIAVALEAKGAGNAATKAIIDTVIAAATK